MFKSLKNTFRILAPNFMIFPIVGEEEEEPKEGPELEAFVEKLQKKASEKQAARVEFMGELLRSKGFIWLATSHFIIGGLQQAGNVLRFANHTWAKIHNLSKKSNNENLISQKIYNCTNPIFTKFTFSKSYFSQNSHLRNLIFTHCTFFKYQIPRNFWIKSWDLSQ